MGREANLHLRGRMFYLRLNVPTELRALREANRITSPAEVWLSLRTSDRREARHRVCREKSRLLASFENEASQLRQGRALQNAVAGSEKNVVGHPCARQLVDERPNSSETVAPSTQPKQGERLENWFERYLSEQHASAVSRSLKDKRATLRRYIEISGDKALEAYSAADMSAFKRALLQCPANAERLFPGRKIDEVVLANVDAKQPLLAPNTVNNKLSTLAAFGDWLELNVDSVRAESFRTSPVRDKRPDQRMAPFSDEEVLAILNAPAFIGCRSERNQLKPGTYRIRDWRYWIPRLAAFTGARLGEVAQLRCEDVYEDPSGWILRLTDEAEGQSLKTSGSRRDVPVHTTLVDAGFGGYVQGVARRGEKWLFEAICVDSDGRRATEAGKWFRRFLERHGVGEGARGAMHRFRHSVVTKLREAGYPDHEIAPLVGHGADVAWMTSRYGKGTMLPIEKRRCMLEKIHYEGLMM